MILETVWKYRVHLALIAIALGAFLWLKIHDAEVRRIERQACTNASLKAENTTLQNTITIKRRQDEIRNAPRSDASTIERMRDGTF